MASASPILVNSPNVQYDDQFITSRYDYQTVECEEVGGQVKAVPKSSVYTFKTDRKVPKLGMMIVGLGGNNGSTVTGAIIANREGIQWRTKEGNQSPDYLDH